MSNNYTIQFTVDVPARTVFKSIQDIAAWWTDDVKGDSEKLDDVFTVQFGNIHISTQKIIERVANKKIVWLVTDSQLNFVEKKHEWTNTKIIFGLSESNNKTHMHFTHVGLVPEVQCYDGCTKGWDYYIQGSLYRYLTEGKGTPGL